MASPPTLTSQNEGMLSSCCIEYTGFVCHIGLHSLSFRAAAQIPEGTTRFIRKPPIACKENALAPHQSMVYGTAVLQGAVPA